MAVKDVVRALIEKQMKNLGYDLASVSFRKEGANYILRVVIDKDGPVSMDDIVRAGDLISPLLDEADPINSLYMLDVTSLGAEKPIKLERLERFSTNASISPSRSRRQKECPRRRTRQPHKRRSNN